MARAGFCGACGENVYLDASGGCPKGHGPEYISGVYDVPDAAAPPAAPASYAPAYAAPPQAEPPKKKRTGLIVGVVLAALLLMCCCGAGAVALISRASSDDASGTSTQAPKPDPEKAKTQAAWSLMKGILQGDAEAIKSVMPSATIAALPPETWTDFAASGKNDGIVFKSETWNGPVLTVITESKNGKATVTVTPSKPDASSVELRSVLENEPPAVLTFKVVDEDGAWKVTAMVTPDTTLPFDAEGLRGAVETP